MRGRAGAPAWIARAALLALAVVAHAVSGGAPPSHKYATRVVRTKYGPLRGIVVHAHPQVEAYLGVPYATPPLGSLRYMPPVTPSRWRSTRLADAMSSSCPQRPPPAPATRADALLQHPRARVRQLERLRALLTNQSEDCLYVNLYVPRIDGADGVDGGYEESRQDGVPTAGLLACLVFIHGESYEWNSAAPYDGTALAANANIIVVTINFRLGVLGFLKTGAKNSAQGNFGVMDLVAGLHWLRENLPAFGGDPERVTLMGHGTGAALANFLAVSPVAKELLKRVILLSGSGLSSWALQREPLTIKRKVAEQTGCHGDLVEDDIAPCLRSLPLSKLLEVRADAPRFLPGFAPFVDGTVLPHPDQAHQPSVSSSGGGTAAVASAAGHEFANFPHRDLMFGLTSIESYLELNAQDLEFGFNETRRDRILRTFVRNAFYYHLNEIYSTLKNEYTDWDKPVQNPLSVRDATLEVLSDGQTAAPLIRLGYLHALRGGSTYFAHFQHLSSDRDYPQRGGSVNGEELPYWLALPLAAVSEHNYTQLDRNVATTLVRYVSNFVNHGNPNDPKRTMPAQPQSPNNELQTSEDQLPFWDTYDTINQLYLEMNNNPEMRSHYRGHKMSLWLSLIPQLHRPGADVPDASMRHHHFQEEGASFYEGAVRPQSMHRPNIPHLNVGVLGNVGNVGSARTSTRTPPAPPAAPAPPPQRPVLAPTTDCPPNNTRETPDDALLRRLASSHYHSYTAALSVTIAVGCFLLLLNVLIFAGIYHQRGGGGRRDSKDDLAEAGSCSSSSAEHYDVKALEMETRAFDAERKAGAFLAATAFDIDARPSFGEYSCYDEKHQRSLPDVSVARADPRDFRRSPRPRRPGQDFGGSAARLDAQTPDIQRTDSQSVRSFERANSFRENRGVPASIVGKTSTFCEPLPPLPAPAAALARGVDCSTQVKFGPPAPRRADSPGDGAANTGTNVTTSEAACGPDEATPPPSVAAAPTSTAPGILRQAANPTGIVKKRVQIQEISV